MPHPAKEPDVYGIIRDVEKLAKRIERLRPEDREFLRQVSPKVKPFLDGGLESTNHWRGEQESYLTESCLELGTAATLTKPADRLEAGCPPLRIVGG